MIDRVEISIPLLDPTGLMFSRAEREALAEIRAGIVTGVCPTCGAKAGRHAERATVPRGDDGRPDGAAIYELCQIRHYRGCRTAKLSMRAAEAAGRYPADPPVVYAEVSWDAEVEEPVVA